MTCRGSYEIIFLSFLIVLCHLQAKTYFYFNMNLHHEDERNACSKNHINITVFYPLFNAKNRRSLCLLVLPVGILLMSPYSVELWRQHPYNSAVLTKQNLACALAYFAP